MSTEAVTTPPATTSIFTSPTTTTNIFGGSIPTTTQSGFGFGTLPVSDSNTSDSFSFGSLTVSALSPDPNNQTKTTSASNFSFVNPTTATPETSKPGFGFNQNIFGQTQAPPSSEPQTQNTFMGSQICSPSPFGQSQQTGNIFGNNPISNTGQSSGNIFGQSGGAGATSPSIFGQSTGGNIFGGTKAPATNSVFGKASTFGQSPLQTNAGFGSKPTFGQSPLAGGVFGQQPSSTFGSTAAPTGNVFGSPGTSSVFGSSSQTSVFGANTGQSSGNIFGTANQNPIAGSFSAGGQSITQTGFGSSAFGSIQKSPSSGFGSPPAFGSPASNFGAPPTFGGSPAFGSPPKVFGGAAPAPVGKLIVFFQ